MRASLPRFVFGMCEAATRLLFGISFISLIPSRLTSMHLHPSHNALPMHTRTGQQHSPTSTGTSFDGR